MLAPSAATAQTVARVADADRLRRLISVELLMLFCYQHILAGPLLPRAHRLMLPLRGHEEAHVRVCAPVCCPRRFAPGTPDQRQQADRDLARRGVGGRLGQLQGGRDALFLLLAVERVVVGALVVALTKLTDPSLVTLAAQIMASDAQHEALSRRPASRGRREGRPLRARAGNSMRFRRRGAASLAPAMRISRPSTTRWSRMRARTRPTSAAG